MKILFVANVIKEHILKFHVPTIKAFSDKGCIVDVIASGDVVVPFARNTYFAKWGRNPFSIKTFRGIGQLRKLLREEKYDIIFCHTPVGGLIGRIVGNTYRKSGTKIIYCAHGFHFYKGAPILNWLLYFPIEKYLAKKSDFVFTVNFEDYLLACKHFKTNCVLVPEVGVDFDRLDNIPSKKIRNEYREKLGIDNDSIVLIYVAELIKNKNQLMLLKALKELKNKMSKIYLLLVGPDHSNGYYHAAAKKMKLQDNVFFLGWRSDIGELLLSSDICVASSKREGFGINIVEAMRVGLPVVATNNRGHRSIIEHEKNGLLVEVDDYKKMADYIFELSANSEIKKKITNIDVEKYEAWRVGKNLCDIVLEKCK